MLFELGDDVVLVLTELDHVSHRLYASQARLKACTSSTMRSRSAPNQSRSRRSSAWFRRAVPTSSRSRATSSALRASLSGDFTRVVVLIITTSSPTDQDQTDRL